MSQLLYYWSKKFLAPNHVIAVMDDNNNKINVTVTHEGSFINQENSNYKVIVNTYTWMNLYPRKSMKLIIGNMNNGLLTYHLSMSEVFTAPFNTTNSFLEFTLQNQNDSEISRNYLFPGNFQTSTLPDPKLKVNICSIGVCEYFNFFSCVFRFFFLRLNCLSRIALKGKYHSLVTV